MLLAPALGAQTARAPEPAVRLPALRPSVGGELHASLPAVQFADRAGIPARVTLRFDPFTREARQRTKLAVPSSSSSDAAARPRCEMPVQRADSSHDRMPVAVPDSSVKYFILVTPPGCVTK